MTVHLLDRFDNQKIKLLTYRYYFLSLNMFLLSTITNVKLLYKTYH